MTFAPLAWLKLQFFCHRGETEIGGFGISAEDDPLYVQDFLTVRQRVSPVTVRFEDDAVADFFDRCVDQGLSVERFARLWCHTHPGESAAPSGTDEETFARVFGGCDWGVMFILSRSGQTYTRLRFSAGPGGSLLLPVQVDWSAWPGLSAGASWASLVEAWQKEYEAHIHVEQKPVVSELIPMGPPVDPWWDTLPWSPELDEVVYELVEEPFAYDAFV